MIPTEPHTAELSQQIEKLARFLSRSHALPRIITRTRRNVRWENMTNDEQGDWLWLATMAVRSLEFQTAPLRPQSAELPHFQVNELIKDEAVWKGCRWEVSDRLSIAWKAICRTKDDAQEIANALEAYARAAAPVGESTALLLEYAAICRQGIEAGNDYRHTVIDGRESDAEEAEARFIQFYNRAFEHPEDNRVLGIIDAAESGLPIGGVGESPAAAPQNEHRIYTSAVIRRGEKFLCIHHDSLGVWLFPGGKPKNGEPFLDCLIRECREELGITITSASFREAFINTVKGRQWAGLFYDVDEFEGEPHILEPQNHSALEWLSFDEMQQRATNQPEMGIASFCRAAAAPLTKESKR